MKSKTRKYSIFFVVMVMVVVSALTVKVNAADSITGSITIVAHEQQNGDTTTNPPLEGVEYTIYKVDETCTDTSTAWNYILENSIEGVEKITGEDGTVVFDNLELGRYFVDTYGGDGAVHNQEFFVDLPMTNAQGTGWDYDIIVEPKIQTAFGNLELTKIDSARNPIEGVTFKVQYGAPSPRDIDPDDVSRIHWNDYISEKSDQVLTVTTGKDGKVTLNNLPYGNGYYRLVEISAPDGYIVNNKELSTLLWEVNGDGTITIQNESSLNSDLFTVTKEDNVTKVTYKNENPKVEKKVKNGGEYVDMVGAFFTDVLEFRITADVPMQIVDMTTYKITDNIPAGLTLNRDSIKVEGTTVDGSETVPADAYTLSQTGLEITFDSQKLADNNYSAIIITYTAKLNMDEAVIGGNGNVNTATLEYTNKINENGDEESTTTTTDTAEVHTGAVAIEKVERGNTDTKLAGAKFKIATTKDNAENGVFVQDGTGVDIEVTTNDQGQAVIEGLKYADDGSNTSYWLVETQAPSYQEDGETKYYNLLKNPVEVQVGSTTHQTAVQIENGKGFELPETGSIGLIIFTVAGITIMTIAYVLNKKQKVQE